MKKRNISIKLRNQIARLNYCATKVRIKKIEKFQKLYQSMIMIIIQMKSF